MLNGGQFPQWIYPNTQTLFLPSASPIPLLHSYIHRTEVMEMEMILNTHTQNNIIHYNSIHCPCLYLMSIICVVTQALKVFFYLFNEI